MTLAAGDRARINAQLSMGQAEQTITVESTTPALQTDEATIGTLITSQATQDLPLNGRNILNLITLSAGVTGGLTNAMNSGTRRTIAVRARISRPTGRAMKSTTTWSTAWITTSDSSAASE